MRHSILDSFENLVRRMDPSAKRDSRAHEHAPEGASWRPRKPRAVAEEGVFLGRSWRRYADGSFEGETVAGMEPFRDLEQFESFVASSPLLRRESAARDPEPSARKADPAVPERVESKTVPENVLPVGADENQARVSPVRPVSASAPKTARPKTRRLVQADLQLPRDLILAGALGLLGCVFWWLHFHVLADLHGELAARGIGEGVIGSTALPPLDRLSCLVLNNEPCLGMKHWGRFAGHLVYEPGFLWAAGCVLCLGIWLLRVRGRQPGPVR